MSKKDLDTLIEEALSNIRNDRKVAREFLNEVANEIEKIQVKTSTLVQLQQNTLKLYKDQMSN